MKIAIIHLLTVFFALCGAITLLAVDPLLEAVESHDLNALQALLLDNPDLNRRYDESRQFSLPFDADFKLVVTNFSLLHIAAGWGDLPILKILLESGANSLLQDLQGITPFDIPSLFIRHQSSSRDYSGCLLLLKEYAKGG